MLEISWPNAKAAPSWAPWLLVWVGRGPIPGLPGGDPPTSPGGPSPAPRLLASRRASTFRSMTMILSSMFRMIRFTTALTSLPPLLSRICRLSFMEPSSFVILSRMPATSLTFAFSVCTLSLNFSCVSFISFSMPVTCRFAWNMDALCSCRVPCNFLLSPEIDWTSLRSFKRSALAAHMPSTRRTFAPSWSKSSVEYLLSHSMVSNLVNIAFTSVFSIAARRMAMTWTSSFSAFPWLWFSKAFFIPLQSPTNC
mmetsp:Transcript_107156/g.239217  ORF Transcript_107156/g.239217 Transcript_107156/m.239217 type:complete len:253 (-) Transcript_107156:1167-1925(-)